MVILKVTSIENNTVALPCKYNMFKTSFLFSRVQGIVENPLHRIIMDKQNQKWYTYYIKALDAFI